MTTLHVVSGTALLVADTLVANQVYRFDLRRYDAAGPPDDFPDQRPTATAFGHARAVWDVDDKRGTFVGIVAFGETVLDVVTRQVP